MGTALAVTRQQSMELADPRCGKIDNTDRRPRCSGLMVAEMVPGSVGLRRSALCAMWRGHRSGYLQNTVWTVMRIDGQGMKVAPQTPYGVPR